MIRKLLAAAALGAVALGSALPAAAQTTIDFSSWQFEDPGTKDWLNEVITDFEATNPDIKINRVYVPFADYLTQMTVRFASGRPPAVVQASEGTFASFAKEGWFAGLDDRIAGTDIAADWAGAQTNLLWDDQTRGVLMANNALMLFYNEKLIADAGVAMPTNFEEFQAAVAAMTNPDAGVYGLSAVTTEHPTVMEDIHRYIAYGGATVTKDGAYNVTSPETIAAVETYRNVVGKNAPLGNNSAVARQLFVDGRTAFLIDGPWVLSFLSNATPEMRPNLKMVEIPWEPQLSPGGITYHVAAGLDPTIADAAWKFIQFTVQPEYQRRYLMVTGQPSGRASPVLTDADIVERPELAVISAAAAKGIPVFPSDQAIRAGFADYTAIMRSAALRVISTNDPVETILAEAQAELERAVPLN